MIRLLTHKLAYIGLVPALFGLLGQTLVFGQTPWQASPVQNGGQPGASQRPNGKIVDLPKPPKSSADQPKQQVRGATDPLIFSLEGQGQRSSSIPNMVGKPTPPTQQPAFPPLPSLAELQSPTPSPTPPSAGLPIPGNRLVGSAKPVEVVPEKPAIRNFKPGELIAVVGTEHILAGDVLPFVDVIIEQNRDKIRSQAEEDKIRSQLTRQALSQVVPTKAMYQEFFRDMLGGKSLDEVETAKESVTTKVQEMFFEQQIPNLFEKYKVSRLDDLEAKLRQKSQSLVTLRRQFVEQVLADQLQIKYVPFKFEADRAEVLEYFNENRDQWQVPARAKWQQLTVRFNQHDSRAEADAKIRQLGNEVLLGGKPFEAVAKAGSEGFNASDGGTYDWTSKGSLKSKQLDAALFSLPLQQMSNIIEDETGFHIIKVLEREAAHEKDRLEVQEEIQKTLSAKKRQEAVKKFRKDVLERTAIWTLWPEDIPGSRHLNEALGAVPGNK